MNDLHKAQAIILVLTKNADIQARLITHERAQSAQYLEELERIGAALVISKQRICRNCGDIAHESKFDGISCSLCDHMPEPIVTMICDQCFDEMYSYACFECMEYRVMRSHNHTVPVSETGDFRCPKCYEPFLELPDPDPPSSSDSSSDSQ